MKNNKLKTPEQEKSAVIPKSLKQMVGERIKVVELYGQVFQSTFGTSLGKYMHPVFGFDVVKFDQLIHPKDGESTKDVVEREYGKEAVDLILKLIKA